MTYLFLDKLTLTSGETVDLYENPDAWPEAVVLDGRIKQKEFTQFSDCGHARLLCRDFRGIENLRRIESQVQLQRKGNSLEITLSNYQLGDLLLVSKMYRPEWRATGIHGRMNTRKILGGLTAMDLQIETKNIKFEYVPVVLYGTILVSYLSTLLSLVGISSGLGKLIHLTTTERNG
jgi:hypothetical protein